MGYQITLDNRTTLSLGFSTVAAEDAATVLDVTVDLLGETTDLYCEEKEEDKDHMFRTLLSKLTSVMTDRAAVMKSFDDKLLSFLQSELGQSMTLHFLHCNAHFLLGMSRSCDIALGMKEKELTETGTNLERDKFPKFSTSANKKQRQLGSSGSQVPSQVPGVMKRMAAEQSGWHSVTKLE